MDTRNYLCHEGYSEEKVWRIEVQVVAVARVAAVFFFVGAERPSFPLTPTSFPLHSRLDAAPLTTIATGLRARFRRSFLHAF